ncbi:MAG: hypothetical protein Q7S88_01455, partial [Candidatus Daviesbacteria bacterium]|nr:hypothetical protein [Candidatus Daviesbacteria bacterium]
MPRQKGFSPLIIIIVVAILGLVAFFGFKNFNSPNPPTKTLPSSNNPPVQKEETNTNLLVPKLTYTGAYNGPLCDASSKMGDSAPLDLHFENMDRNGVTCVIAYTFAEEVVSTDHIKGIIKKYPGRIIPFYSPGLGGKEAERFVG